MAKTGTTQKGLPMKDSEARQIVLQYLYENRRDPPIPIANIREGRQLIPGVDFSDFDYAAKQLHEKGLVNYEIMLNGGGYISITTCGVEEIENRGVSGMIGIAPVTVNKNTTNNNITSSSQGDAMISVAGDVIRNTSTSISMGDLIQKVNAADATPAEKEEATSLLKGLMDNALIGGLISGSISGLITLV